jgi:uncharacterized phage protein gp47/JayE
MTVYGLTTDGFVEKTGPQILADLAAAQRASPALGADWDATSAESPEGQINGIFTAALASAWEAIGLVYRSRTSEGASFAGLDALAGLTGTTRRAATFGTVTLTLSVGAGRTIPAGSVAHVAGQASNRWVTLADAVNSTGSTANVTVSARAEAAGVYTANATTITVIATPVTGWLSVTNASDAVPGAPVESDPVLRVRRRAELFAQGESVIDAVRRGLVNVDGVATVTVDENDTDLDERYRGGLPPHSLEAIVQGGTDTAVAAALWASKAGGIRTYGTTSATTADAGGVLRTVHWTRPALVDAYVFITYEIDPATYAGDDALIAAIVAVTAGQLAGAPIRRSDVFRAVRSVPGVIDCDDVWLGREAVTVFRANLLASPREILKLGTGRIAATVVTP